MFQNLHCCDVTTIKLSTSAHTTHICKVPKSSQGEILAGHVILTMLAPVKIPAPYKINHIFIQLQICLAFSSHVSGMISHIFSKSYSFIQAYNIVMTKIFS